MGNIKDAYYFSHDSNARNDPKIMALLNTYGVEGYGRWWIVVEMLSEQCEYSLPIKDWAHNALAMAMNISTQEVKEFIQSCIDEFELLDTDGEYFWSNSLLRRMEKKEEVRKKRSEAGKKGAVAKHSHSDDAASTWQTHGNAMAKPEQTHGNAMANPGKESKGKESKGKESESKENYADYVRMTPAQHQKLIDRYGEKAAARMIEILDNYKGSKGKQYKDDYRAILSWVVSRYEEEKQKQIGGTMLDHPSWKGVRVK